MAADYARLVAQLRSFYDFTAKAVLLVGAGGGQLLDPTIKPKKLIAIDHDRDALGKLERRVADQGMQDFVEVVCAQFEEVALSGDVVYFEFCLHEMADPMKALLHARTLAPDIVVFDHDPNSAWAFHAAEEEEVRRSSEAMERFGIRRRQSFRAEQTFRDYAEFLAKLSTQGPVAIGRAREFAGATAITIPMDCQLALL
jgi:2-polyprenyl-3-methyl-5-hydroxy-6-metoxy-1,4-benzoquinol methylase